MSSTISIDEEVVNEVEPQSESPERQSMFTKLSAWFKDRGNIIYFSQGFSAWGDRMWSFAFGLFLVSLNDGYLTVLAASGLFSGVCAIIAGGPIGKWVDNHNRLKVCRIALLSQNTLVAMAAGGIIVIQQYKEELKNTDLRYAFYLAQTGVILIATAAKIMSIPCKIVLEKDWVIEISGGRPSKLARMNTILRTVDLCCNIAAPAITGQLFSFVGKVSSAVVIAVWNIVSMVIEYMLMRSIYRGVTSLHTKKGTTVEEKEKRVMKKGHFESWRIYKRQPTFLAGIAMAMLYMTTLGFDTVEVGYAYSQGVLEAVLGAMMGAGALSGVFGALSYPTIRRKIKLERTGLWALFLQNICLVICVASVWSPGSPFENFGFSLNYKSPSDTCFVPAISKENVSAALNGSAANIFSEVPCSSAHPSLWTSVVLLLVGMTLSRFGLWLFDLVYTQILQEGVDEMERGSVNGIQYALNMFMSNLKFVLVLFVPKPSLFGYLVLGSYTITSSAFCIYALYSFRLRGHLLPHCLRLKAYFSRERKSSVEEQRESSNE